MAASQACCQLGLRGGPFLLDRKLAKQSKQAASTNCQRGSFQRYANPCRKRVNVNQSVVVASAGPQESTATEPVSVVLSRRALASAAAAATLCAALPSQARERRQPKVDAAEYSTNEEGLKYYDFNPGKGPEAAKGKKVVVHFDCVYKTLTVVSSRSSKLLGGNRVIAQPYELVVGSKPGSERKRDFVDNANGLFSAQAAPKPPPALYTVVEGMRVGGKRTVIVPPEFGYGQKGIGEIPPGATFDLNIELLEVDDVQKNA